MIRTIGIVAGGYAILAFVIFLYRLVVNLEEGMKSGDAFSAALGSGIIWPITLLSQLMG